jgi:hypothetical protein
MSRLARRNRVLFTSPPWHVRDVLSGRCDDGSGLSRVADNLYTCRPPRWLPCSDRFPRFNRCSLRARSHLLSWTARRLGMDRPILYIWHSAVSDVIGGLDERLVVYHDAGLAAQNRQSYALSSLPSRTRRRSWPGTLLMARIGPRCVACSTGAPQRRSDRVLKRAWAREKRGRARPRRGRARILAPRTETP